MANLTAKTSSNIFYKARCEAATHNEQLSSRDMIKAFYIKRRILVIVLIAVDICKKIISIKLNFS